MKPLTKQAGFTLIEIVISLTIIGLLGVLIVQVFFTTTRVNTKSELLNDIKQNGQFAIDTISRMIRNAQSVTTLCSPSGTTSSSVTLTHADGDSTILECVYDNAVTRIASSSAQMGTSEYVTSENLTLGGASCDDAAMSLQFYCISYPDQPSKITVNFRLSQKGTSTSTFEQASQEFQTMVNLRN